MHTSSADFTPPRSLSEVTKEQIARVRMDDTIRFLSCLDAWDGNVTEAALLYLERWPRSFSHGAIDALRTKAAVAPGTTTDGTWASPLVAAKLADAFAAPVYAASVLGRLGAVETPFATNVTGLTSGAVFSWKGEGAPKPVTKLAFATVVPSLAMLKAIGIIAVSKELLTLMAPRSVDLLREYLIGACANFVDTWLLDPTKAGVAGESPASILNGITATAAGADADATASAVIAALFTSLPNASRPTVICSPAGAAKLAAGGKNPDLNARDGGLVHGLPCVTTSGAGNRIVALDAASLFVAHGDVEFDTSQHASIDLSDAPDTPPVASTVPTSLWQMNLTAIKVEAFANWKALTGAVAWATLP